MIVRYIVAIQSSYIEDFADEDTGQVVSLKRWYTKYIRPESTIITNTKLSKKKIIAFINEQLLTLAYDNPTAADKLDVKYQCIGLIDEEDYVLLDKYKTSDFNQHEINKFAKSRKFKW